MKIILFLLSLSLGFFANATPGDYNENPYCDITNYKDCIDKETGVYQCNLRKADLTSEELSKANLRGADLTGAKVTREQAEDLRAQGLSGFVVVE